MALYIRFPKTRLKRGVGYTTDSLLGMHSFVQPYNQLTSSDFKIPISKISFVFSVSFGGAFGLYLGCSLISMVEFLYFLSESLIETIVNVGRTLKLKFLSKKSSRRVAGKC